MDDDAAQWALVHGDRLAAQLDAFWCASVAVHLPGVDVRHAVLELCRSGRHRLVSLDASPNVVVTADGVVEAGCIRALKEEVDAIVPRAERMIVIRNVGEAPLAPTMDAYLDVQMTPGRDVWL
jgi:hypothetical protein